jgi:hypothetical protein
MFRLSIKAFLIGLFALSSLWVAVTFFPILYSIAAPPRDLQQVVCALEMRCSAPPQAAAAVQAALASAGPLRRAVQVGYYSGATETVQLNASHISKRTQISYAAWFQNVPKPVLLVISRSESDGVFEGYRVLEGEPMSLVVGYASPLLLFAFSLYLLRRKNNPPAMDRTTS